MIAASLNLALGNAGLMLMLAAMTFGALSTAFSIRTGNTRTLRMAPRYAWLGLAGAVLAVVMMQRALITRDFSLAYVQQVGSTATPPLYNVAAMWSSLEGSILLWAIIISGYTAAVAWRFRRAHRRSPRRLGARRDVRRRRVLRARQLRPRRRRSRTVPPGVLDGPGPNPLLQNHVLVLFHPPILYLGYVGFTVPFAFAIAALDHRPGRRGVVDGDQALGAVLVGAAHDRHPARRLVELRGARLEWRVGLGPGRERQPPAVADRDRVHPLGARPGAARDAAGVEPQPARRHVRADDPRHVPHPVGRDQQRPRVRRRTGRRLPARVLRARRRGVAGAHRLAGRPPAVARRDRLAGVTRRARSSPTTCCSRCSRSSCCWAPCSRCSSRRCRTAGRRRGAVLRPTLDADRHRAAVPDGRSRRCCRGARRRPSCCATGCSGRRGAAPSRSAIAVVVGADGLGAAGRVRPRRVRRRRGRCARSCSPPGGRAGAASSGGPTAAWSCTSA